MAREGGMDKDRDINIKDGEVFPNKRAENNTEKGKAMQSLQQIWDEVERILERNRMLIHEIDQNHEIHQDGGLNPNFARIFELRGNMAHLVKLYSNLSSAFSRSLVKGSSVSDDDTKGDKKEAMTSAVDETEY